MINLFIEIIVLAIWIKASISDLNTKSVKLLDCILISVLSLLIGFLNGNRLLLIIPILLLCILLFADDNSKYIGSADLLIPIHFISVYIHAGTTYTNILFILSTMCYALALYMIFHKYLVGKKWTKGMITAGLPPYCLTIVFVFEVKVIYELILKYM